VDGTEKSSSEELHEESEDAADHEPEAKEIVDEYIGEVAPPGNEERSDSSSKTSAELSAIPPFDSRSVPHDIARLPIHMEISGAKVVVSHSLFERPRRHLSDLVGSLTREIVRIGTEPPGASESPDTSQCPA
jgi:hypothetical protein